MQVMLLEQCGFSNSVTLALHNILKPEEVIPMAIISYILNLSLAKKFAAEYDYEVDANQEAVASSISNLLGSFFMTIPSAVSLSRTSLQASAGGRTQLTSIISTITLGIVVSTLGKFFSVLPKAVLASIVVVNLRGMLRQERS